MKLIKFFVANDGRVPVALCARKNEINDGCDCGGFYWQPSVTRLPIYCAQCLARHITIIKFTFDEHSCHCDRPTTIVHRCGCIGVTHHCKINVNATNGPLLGICDGKQLNGSMERREARASFTAAMCGEFPIFLFITMMMMTVCHNM